MITITREMVLLLVAGFVLIVILYEARNYIWAKAYKQGFHDAERVLKKEIKRLKEDKENE